MGPSKRMALYFQPVRQEFQARYLSSVDEAPRSRLCTHWNGCGWKCMGHSRART
ncbi:hypothetical protein ACN28S_05705 [Cystobacter fuscus]